MTDADHPRPPELAHEVTFDRAQRHEVAARWQRLAVHFNVPVCEHLAGAEGSERHAADGLQLVPLLCAHLSDVEGSNVKDALDKDADVRRLEQRRVHLAPA